jgi:hypothetical protein
MSDKRLLRRILRISHDTPPIPFFSSFLFFPCEVSNSFEIYEVHGAQITPAPHVVSLTQLCRNTRDTRQVFFLQRMHFPEMQQSKRRARGEKKTLRTRRCGTRTHTRQWLKSELARLLGTSLAPRSSFLELDERGGKKGGDGGSTDELGRLVQIRVVPLTHPVRNTKVLLVCE